MHAIYIRYFAKEKEFAADASPKAAAQLPARIPRHSLAARLFHWIMAASMFTLLFTAFLPKVGVQFDWVTYHWIAGTVLTISIIFHIIHASFFWTSGRSGRTGLTSKTPGKEFSASWESLRPAAEIRQVSAGEQALSRRYHRDRTVRDRDRRVHDVPRAHDFLSPQSVSIQRHDLGPDVRAARAGGRRTDRAGHGAHLLCGPA